MSSTEAVSGRVKLDPAAVAAGPENLVDSLWDCGSNAYHGPWTVVQQGPREWFWVPDPWAMNCTVCSSNCNNTSLFFFTPSWVLYLSVASWFSDQIKPLFRTGSRENSPSPRVPGIDSTRLGLTRTPPPPQRAQTARGPKLQIIWTLMLRRRLTIFS